MAIEKDLKSILGKLKYTDDAKVVAQITDQMKQVQARMAGIKHKLVVMSGKGGVGKKHDDRQPCPRLGPSTCAGRSLGRRPQWPLCSPHVGPAWALVDDDA